MALGSELISKQLVVLKADASQFKAEMKAAGAVEQKVMKERHDAMERQNAMLERSNQRFGLYAAAAVAGWSLVSAGVKKYEEHLKSLGASGEAELGRLQGMTKSLNSVQDSLLITIGKLALATEPLVTEFAKMAQELANIAGGIAGIVAAAKDIPGAGYVGTGIRKAIRYGGPWGVVTGGADAYGALFGDDTVEPGRAFSGWARAGEFGMMNAEDKWREWVRDRLPAEPGRPDKPGDARRRGGGGSRRGDGSWYGDLAGRARLGLQRYGNAYEASQADVTTTWDRGGGAIDWQTQDAASAASKDLAEHMKDLERMAKEGEKHGLFSRIFGTPDELNATIEALGVASSATDTLAAATSGVLQAWIDGEEGLGKVFKRMVAQGLSNIAADLMGKSTRHGIEAAAHAVLMDWPGAARHAGAAGIYAAGALAIGGVAKGLGGSGGGSAPSAGRGNANAAAGMGGGARGGNANNANLTVVMGDGFADDSPRYKARRVRRAINNARNLYPESGATEPG